MNVHKMMPQYRLQTKYAFNEYIYNTDMFKEQT